MSIKKDYKISECVLVTRSVLEGLYCKYYDNYPVYLKNELINFLKSLRIELEKEHIYI